MIERSIAPLAYLSIGAIFHVLMIGPRFDAASVWSWTIVLGWPFIIAAAGLTAVGLMLLAEVVNWEVIWPLKYHYRSWKNGPLTPDGKLAHICTTTGDGRCPAITARHTGAATMYSEVSQVRHAEVRDRARASQSGYTDTDEPGEGAPATTPGEPITPTMVNWQNIRSVSPRKDTAPGEPRTGCRIVFRDGRGFAVTDLFGELQAVAETAGFLLLTKVVNVRRGRSADEDDDGENGYVTSDAGEEATTPVLVNPTCIRSFNRRKDRSEHEPRIGVRFMFSDGRGFPVRETYDVVQGMLAGAQAR